MIVEYNRKSLIYGIPGIILQIGGSFLRTSEGELTLPGALLILIGTALLLVGFVYYAKAKGRHPAWSLLGFLSLIGLLILALLKDKSNLPSSEAV
jgi:hypothetical protein